MSRNEFDELSEFEEWSDAVDCALRSHRVGSAAFTDSERRAAFDEGYDAAESAENFALAYHAACVGYDEPDDYDEDADSFDPSDFADCVAPGDRDVPHDHADNPSRFRDAD